jgi:hypothetical protein
MKMKNEQKKSTPSGAPISTKDYGTTPEEKSEAERLFDKIGTGMARAVKRPKDRAIDRQLRRLISDANQTGDCIIAGSTGYYRPGDDDSVEAEVYFASERHRARVILRKVRKMEEVYNRRYQ